jgi:uncharacterized protein with GYD domain
MFLPFSGELAYHGHRVKVYDHNINILNSTYERIEEDKKSLREGGLMTHKNFVVSGYYSLASCEQD